jgi:hypothetical protein
MFELHKSDKTCQDINAPIEEIEGAFILTIRLKLSHWLLFKNLVLTIYVLINL